MTETTVVCLCFSYLEKEVPEDGYWLHFSETSCFNTQACYFKIFFRMRIQSLENIAAMVGNRMIRIGKLLCDILWWDRHTNKGLKLTDELLYSEIHFCGFAGCH